MKTFISDVIPKFQRYSKKLDDFTLLTNKHWIVLDEIDNAKNVYIFRSNNQLLISQNGKVEKAKWEYLGNNSLLIDRTNESLLFKHGFFDENILALKIDSKNEYAFLINESKFNSEINSLEDVADYLKNKYSGTNDSQRSDLKIRTPILVPFSTDKGTIKIELPFKDKHPTPRDKVFMSGKKAPTGVYKLGFMWYLHVEDGIIKKVNMLG